MDKSRLKPTNLTSARRTSLVIRPARLRPRFTRSNLQQKLASKLYDVEKGSLEVIRTQKLGQKRVREKKFEIEMGFSASAEPKRNEVMF